MLVLTLDLSESTKTGIEFPVAKVLSGQTSSNKHCG